MESTTIVLGRTKGRVYADSTTIAILERCFRTTLEDITDFEIRACAFEGLSSLIEQTIDKTYEQQRSSLYVDAATLVSKEGRALMLAGASQRGKTTTALALCLTAGFRFICEDISIIDFSTQSIVNVIAPLSIRPKTLELYSRFGLPDLALIEERWYACRELFLERDLRVDSGLKQLIILLSPGDDNVPLETMPLTPANAIRLLLPISNLLLQENACENLLKTLSHTEVIGLTGGSLAERLYFLAGKPDQ